MVACIKGAGRALRESYASRSAPLLSGRSRNTLAQLPMATSQKPSPWFLATIKYKQRRSLYDWLSSPRYRAFKSKGFLAGLEKRVALYTIVNKREVF